MRLAGLQKLTLLDYPGQLACTVFTQGCNMRCPFCQNADLVLPERFEGGELLTEDAFFSFLESRKGKLAGVAVTGGEPTLHADLPQFLGRIREMGFLAKLDTNGTNPGMLEQIVKAGLVNYVAMDIKNAPSKYALTAGIPDPQGPDSPGERLQKNIQQSISFLMEDRVPYEFRTTVVDGLHTKEDIVCMAKWLEGARAWYLQQFIPSERMVGFPDIGECTNMTAPSSQQLLDMCEAARQYVPTVQVRGV